MKGYRLFSVAKGSGTNINANDNSLANALFESKNVSLADQLFSKVLVSA